jgi:hypothetical protein
VFAKAPPLAAWRVRSYTSRFRRDLREDLPAMIDSAIEKAHALVEALGYIQRFHDKVVVVKVGGSIMD